MRLWHYKIVPLLDNKRLLSQHRECCALRGKGWGKKHSTVDYVFNYSYAMLYNYHNLIVLTEFDKRNFNYNYNWLSPRYRGKLLGFVKPSDWPNFGKKILENYPEHDQDYYEFCKNLLLSKDEKYYQRVFK